MNKETELFEPIKKHLEKQGCEVYQEVKDIDVVGINRITGEVVLVEMKLSFNVKVILQALENKLHFPDAKVYIAFPKDNGMKGLSKSDYEKIRLLNYTGKHIGIMICDTSSYNLKIDVLERGQDKTSNVFAAFNRACKSFNKQKTAGAKTGETLTERQIIINRIKEILKVLQNNECLVDDLIDTLYPEILEHYSSKESFISVMRNTASSTFEIKDKKIKLKEN